METLNKIILSAVGVSLLSGSLFAETFTDKISVSSSEPVYGTIIKKIPQEVCWDEQVNVKSGGSDYSNIGTVIGGISGAALNNSKQTHQKILTGIGGAIIGNIVGDKLSSPETYTTQVQRKCKTEYTESQEQIVKGYKNYFNFNGKQYIKESNQPLQYIQITTTF